MRKAFIGGSKTINKLNDVEIKILDELMKDGIQILIGDCFGVDKLVQEYLYKNNYDKVYVYTSVNVPRVNIGLWSVCWCKTDNTSGYLKHMQKDLRMAKACDYSIMFWDEESKGTFINMLELVKLDKTVTLILHDSGITEEVDLLEDIKKYVKNEKGFLPDLNISKEEWAEILDEFVPSKDMQSGMLNDCGSTDVRLLIKTSPVPFSKKCDWAEKLSKRENLKKYFFDAALTNETVENMNAEIGWEYKHSFLRLAREYKKANNNLVLSPGELLILNRCWYDWREYSDNRESIAPFKSLDDALAYIRQDIAELNEAGYQEDKLGMNPLYWYQLQKWVPNNTGSYDNTYSYILIDDEIIYVEPNELSENGLWWNNVKDFNYINDGISIKMKGTFKPGDIVRIDCTPFNPAMIAVVLETEGDHWVYCDSFPTVLVKKPDNRWDICGVGMSSMFTYGECRIPAKFRLEKYDGDIPEDLQLLQTVSDYIDGDELRGQIIYYVEKSGDELKKAILEIISNE